MVHPVREHIPIYLAVDRPEEPGARPARSPTAGWPVFFAPEFADEQLAPHRGRPRARPARPSTASTSSPTVPLVVGDDVEACADPVRAYAALYIGGMGSREQNFYNALAVRMGFGDAAARSRTSTWPATTTAPRRPSRWSSSTRPSLLGPVERIAERMADLRRGRRHHALLVPFGDTPTNGSPRCAPRPRRSTNRASHVTPPGRRDSIDVLLQAIVLGIVQGLTEFLPISSTAHLRIVPALFGGTSMADRTTRAPRSPRSSSSARSLAMVLYFWRELVHVTVAWFRGLYDRVRAGHASSTGSAGISSSPPCRSASSACSSATRSRPGRATSGSIAQRADRARAGAGAAEKVGSATARRSRSTPTDAVVGRHRAGARADPRRVPVRHDDHRRPVPRADPRGGGPVLLPAVDPGGVLSGGYEAVKPRESPRRRAPVSPASR